MTNGNMHATTMSNRLFCCLDKIVKGGGLTLSEALQISQSTLGPVIKRGYLKWDQAEELFLPTPLAEAVREQFYRTDISRQESFRPLSSYVKDRSVLALAEQEQAHLKEEYKKKQVKQARGEREGDKLKRKRAELKAVPTSRSRKVAA